MLIVSSFASYQPNSKNMNELEFTKHFLEQIVKDNPSMEYQIIDNLEIQAEKDKRKIKHYLNNAYLEYKQNPKELERIIKRSLKSSKALYAQLDKNLVNKDKIIPVVKPYNYITYLEETYAPNKPNLVFERYNNELVIVYGEDSETNVQYFGNDDFEKLDLTKGALLQLAKKNLYEILPSLEKHGDSEFSMLVAGGDFEASLIVLDIWDKNNFPVKGEIVIGVPNKDLLCVTGSEDKEGIQKLKKSILDTHYSGSYPISDQLFILKEGKFEVWEDE